LVDLLDEEAALAYAMTVQSNQILEFPVIGREDDIFMRFSQENNDD
jgi:hypothetical protein